MVATPIKPGPLPQPPVAPAAASAGPTAMEEYFFDLRGYTVLDAALSADELADINGWVDEREEVIRAIMRSDPVDYMPIEPSLSLDGMHVQSYHNGERNRRSHLRQLIRPPNGNRHVRASASAHARAPHNPQMRPRK